MMSCRNSSAVSDVCRSLGKVALNPFLFLAAERGVRHHDVDPVAISDLAHTKAKGIERIDLRRLDSVEKKVHLTEEIGERLCLDTKERA